MKRILSVLLCLCLLGGAAAFAEGEEGLTFATVGEALDAAGENRVVCGTDTTYVVALEYEGKFIRVVADMDDEGRALNDAIPEAEDLEAAFLAYGEYVRTLPVRYEEEFTVQPKSREELDAFVGKTYIDLEEAGFDYMSSGTEGDKIVFGMADGVYQYDFEMDTDFEGYEQAQEDGSYDDLVIKAAGLAGLSANAAELRYHADGAVDPEEDFGAEDYGEAGDIIEMITGLIAAAENGEEFDLDPEELIAELTKLAPDSEEEIRTLVEMIMSLNTEE